MEEMAPAIIIQSPPVWSYLLAPGASLLGVLIGFLLSRFQGRDQVKYIRRAEIATKLREEALDIISDLKVLSEHEQNENREQHSKKVVDRVYEFGKYYRRNEPWLSHKLRNKVKPIRDKFAQGTFGLIYDEGVEDIASNLRFSDSIENIKEMDFDAVERELTNEVERLLGTQKRLWSRGEGHH